jgi:hypothetical protein
LHTQVIYSVKAQTTDRIVGRENTENRTYIIDRDTRGVLMERERRMEMVFIAE